MAVFRCLKSKETVNYTTGADLGSSTTTTYTLPNTPLVAGSLSGTIYAGATPIQVFTVDVFGAFMFSNIGTPTTRATAGAANLGTGVITLTWNSAPGTNFAIVSYVGLPVYKNLTKRLFYAKCPKVNTLCSGISNGFVAAVAVCNTKLYV